jgi:hypothetical protein
MTPPRKVTKRAERLDPRLVEVRLGHLLEQLLAQMPALPAHLVAPCEGRLAQRHEPGALGLAEAQLVDHEIETRGRLVAQPIGRVLGVEHAAGEKHVQQKGRRQQDPEKFAAHPGDLPGSINSQVAVLAGALLRQG